MRGGWKKVQRFGVTRWEHPNGAVIVHLLKTFTASSAYGLGFSSKRSGPNLHIKIYQGTKPDSKKVVYSKTLKDAKAQLTTKKNPAHPKVARRAMAKRNPTHKPVIYEDDPSEFRYSLTASWGDDGYVQYGLTDDGHIALLVINSDRSIGLTGRKILKWLKSKYKKPVIAYKVWPGVIGFWDKMQDEGLVADWTDDYFGGNLVPLIGTAAKRNPAHPKVARRAMAIAIAKARIRSWDVQGNYDHIIQFLSQVMNVSPEEADRRLMNRDPEDEPIFQLFINTHEDLINHRFMLPPSKNWVYVNHTAGLRAGEEYGWDFTKLIKKILREGVVPQAEGSGKYSECPGAVFGIGDYPRGQKWGDRLYNMRHFPWITFRVPKTQWAPRGGSVCTFSRIPAKDIVGICGIPASVMRKELGV